MSCVKNSKCTHAQEINSLSKLIQLLGKEKHPGTLINTTAR